MSISRSIVTRSSTGSKLVISVVNGKIDAEIYVPTWRTLSEMQEMLKMVEDLAKMYHEIPTKIILTAHGEEDGASTYSQITFENGNYEVCYGVERELDLPADIVKKVMPSPKRIRPGVMKVIYGIVNKLERDTGYSIVLNLNYPLGFKVVIEKSKQGITNFKDIQKELKMLRRDVLEASKVLVERLRREILNRLGGRR